MISATQTQQQLIALHKQLHQEVMELDSQISALKESRDEALAEMAAVSKRLRRQSK